MSSCGIDNEEKAISDNHTQNLNRIKAIIKHNDLKPDYIFKNMNELYDNIGSWTLTKYNDKVIQILDTKGIQKREEQNNYYWSESNIGNLYEFELFPKKEMTNLPKSIIGYYIVNNGDWYEFEEGIFCIQLHGVQEYNGGKK